MSGDLIVEERHWRRGVEVVSHVNHTQIARVRRSLGLTVESWRHALAGRPRLISDAIPAARPAGSERWRRRHSAVGTKQAQR